MSCGADTEANQLLTSLLAGKTFAIPDVDLENPAFDLPEFSQLDLPAKLENSDLTTGTIAGSGTLDQVLNSLHNHLRGEYEKNRITGAEFTKAYIALTQSALASSVQFLLGKDQAYWQAVAAQVQARIGETQLVTARVALEIAKAELQSKRYEALNQEAGYGLIKLKLATESMGYCLAKFNLDEMAPIQKLAATEQMEAARAQTMDTRSDNVTPILGLMGKQKDLYSQQITSYKRDAEVKAAKLFTDAWITQKTIDEGLLPPTAFNNISLDEILMAVKTNNGLN